MEVKRAPGRNKVLIAGIIILLCWPKGGEMGNALRREQEWPVIISVATKEGLDQKEQVMLLAIRDAENGSPGNEFGAMDVQNTKLYTQATSAARSIRNNRMRYQQYIQEGKYKGSRRSVTLKSDEKPMDFIDFMWRYGGPTGYGYAPVDAAELSEEHKELNKNWAPNVRKLMEKYQKLFKDKGVQNE